jgi:methyl-accepting chemotaxis protein
MSTENNPERQVTLFSETDVFGTITFANEAFCRISKYTFEELIGKPHNIIRHPDMPMQLFKLLWSTVKDGEVFRGVIKNRAKDGSHYWVNATIMPITNQHKKITKFIGARHVIANEKLAMDLYAQQMTSYKYNQR